MDACPTCGKLIDEHLVREWRGCSAAREHLLDYEKIPGAPIDARTAISIDEITDHLTVRSLAVERIPEVGPLALVHFEFGQGATPKVAATFASTPATMRKTGKIVRDAMFGAANVAR